MKNPSTQNLFLLLAIVFSIQTISSAQTMRSVDISTRLVSPLTGTNIPTGTPMQLIVSYKNMGPDTLQISDTIRLALLMDSYLVQFGIPSDSFLSRETGKYLLPGDSFIRQYPPISFGNEPDGNHSICVQAYTRGADLRDPVMFNNRACATISTGPLSVDDLSEEALSFYPQPVSNVLSWKLPAGKSVKTASVYDLTGRQVLEQEGAANSLSVSHLPNGFYSVQMQLSDGEVYRQKIQVLH